jgi:hypothetical protein
MFLLFFSLSKTAYEGYFSMVCKVKHLGTLLHAFLYVALVVYTFIYLQSEVTKVQEYQLTGNVSIFMFWPCQSQTVYHPGKNCTFTHCVADNNTYFSAPSDRYCSTAYQEFGPLVVFSPYEDDHLLLTYTYLRYQCNVSSGASLVGMMNWNSIPYFATFQDFNITQEIYNAGWPGNTSDPFSAGSFLPFSKIFGLYSGDTDVRLQVVVISQNTMDNSTRFNADVEFNYRPPIFFGKWSLAPITLRFMLGNHQIVIHEKEYQWRELIYLSVLLLITLLEILFVIGSNCRCKKKKDEKQRTPNDSQMLLSQVDELE